MRFPLLGLNCIFPDRLFFPGCRLGGALPWGSFSTLSLAIDIVCRRSSGAAVQASGAHMQVCAAECRLVHRAGVRELLRPHHNVGEGAHRRAGLFVVRVRSAIPRRATHVGTKPHAHSRRDGEADDRLDLEHAMTHGSAHYPPRVFELVLCDVVALGTT